MKHGTRKTSHRRPDGLHELYASLNRFWIVAIPKCPLLLNPRGLSRRISISFISRLREKSPPAVPGRILESFLFSHTLRASHSTIRWKALILIPSELRLQTRQKHKHFWLWKTLIFLLQSSIRIVALSVIDYVSLRGVARIRSLRFLLLKLFQRWKLFRWMQTQGRKDRVTFPFSK